MLRDSEKKRHVMERRMRRSLRMRGGEAVLFTKRGRRMER